jgi:kinesin family protein C1
MIGTSSKEGMIPLAVKKVFEDISQLPDWEFEVSAMIFEIYRDQFQDLLNPDSDLKYEVKENGVFTQVSNMTVVKVVDAKDLVAKLEIASANRFKAYTACNDKSSRSHSIFNLTLHGTNKKLNQETFGVLNFVDLAGSERLKESHSEGIRLEETKYINKSLSALGDVIHAIAAKDKFIPFRNSKLTYYLKNYLGKDSKCLMFVNISPFAKNVSETINSLRFASKVNTCELGKANKIHL